MRSGKETFGNHISHTSGTRRSSRNKSEMCPRAVAFRAMHEFEVDQVVRTPRSSCARYFKRPSGFFGTPGELEFLVFKESTMAKKRKYSKSAGKEVEGEMRRYKRGTAKSGRGKKKVKSRKQAIAIGLSKARKKGKKVPRKKR